MYVEFRTLGVRYVLGILGIAPLINIYATLQTIVLLYTVVNFLLLGIELAVTFKSSRSLICHKAGTHNS